MPSKTTPVARRFVAFALLLTLSACATYQRPPSRVSPTAPPVAIRPSRAAPPPARAVPPAPAPRVAAPAPVPVRPAPAPVPRAMPPAHLIGGGPRPPAEAAPAPPPAPVIPFRTVVAVQAALDRNNFSCGCIDGVLASHTRDALRAWQAARGLPVTGEIDAATLRRVGNLDAEFTTYAVAPSDLEGLTPFPTSWAAKAALAHMNYSTVQEALAERFHMSEAALQQLNPGAAWPDPPAGTVLAVPSVAPARHVDAARLEISLTHKTLKLVDAQGKVVGLFPCSIARDKAKRPVGELKVVNAASDPVYTFDPAIFPEEPEARAIGAKLIIPPGPNNPVGVAWVGLDKPGYGIHGTAWPEDIGKTESHGCFRLANWNARKLTRMVKVGTPVVVEP